ncbi:MAG: hypothetical protein ACJ74Q_05270 [Pyrinomonadaceae bacterium]
MSFKRPSLKSKVSLKDLGVEHRGESRIGGPFPAIALDLSPNCKKLGVYTVIEDFSASGFYMLRERPAELGECLVVITQISQATVMLQGTVVRVEAQKDGTYGLGVAVKRHQIFSLKKIAPLKSTRALAETQAIIS